MRLEPRTNFAASAVVLPFPTRPQRFARALDASTKAVFDEIIKRFAHDRGAAEYLVEGLIAALDRRDGDADLEETSPDRFGGGFVRYEGREEHEDGDSDDDRSDLEPWLGSPDGQMNQRHWSAGTLQDLEEVNEDGADGGGPDARDLCTGRVLPGGRYVLDHVVYERGDGVDRALGLEWEVSPHV